MLDLFSKPPTILPEWILHQNLLQLFLWYIAGVFLLSLLLRVRFYHSVLEVVRHVRYSCPRIFSLVNEHWFLCLRGGLVTWASLYLVLLAPYYWLNQHVWPRATVTFHDLGAMHPAILAFALVLIGLMLTLDLLLLAQVSVIDVDRVKADLTWSETWLAGSLYRMLENLGRWNPIKRYADQVTRQNIQWLNRVFRYSLWSMITQLGLRLSVAVSLYSSYWFAAGTG